jgi:hypothetical protein
MPTHLTEKQMIKDREVLFGKSFARELATAIASFALLLAGYVPCSFAQQQEQQTFHSAEEAGSALFAAAQNDDEKAALDILGPAAKEVISSGDPVEDLNERVGFVVKYQEMHRYAKEPDGTTVLYVGAENWPFPIPLVNNNHAWYFDTDAGKQEILMRRIGGNELAAIDACHEFVDAEKQYKAKARLDGSANQYAQTFISDSGQHNGLSWSANGDESESFIDPRIASAGQENAKSSDAPGGDPIPFNGYFFRLLKSQGKDAPGGAKRYIVNGKMVGGFGFIAYPAEYRSSGVMTFVVNESGVVYEKDLGPNTIRIATTMSDYNPDSTWHEVDEAAKDSVNPQTEGEIP